MKRTRNNKPPAICTVEGCNGAHVAKGWCRKHYLRNYHHGNPKKTLQRPTEAGMEFVQNMLDNPTDKCVEWPFSTAARGYGRINYEGETQYVTRVVLKMTVGEPPTPEHEACHMPLICHNTKCINDAHLRWATHAENMADMAIDGTRSGGGAFHKSYLEKTA